MQILHSIYNLHRDMAAGGQYILDEQGLQDRVATSFYRLDGDADYLELTDNADQDVDTTDFTLSVRFKVDDITTAEQWLINKESGGIGYGLELKEDDLHIRLDDNTTDVSAKIATAVFLNDVWYHVLVRFDRSGDATAYINGIRVGTVAISTASLTLNNAGAFRIGTESGGTTLELTGQVSHARLFNYLVSETDAKSYSQGGAIDYSDIGPTQTTQTSGTLTIGKRYRLDDFITGDDFTNIGATNADGNEFIATGTTPTTWTNSSVVRKIGALCDYRPSSIISATWYDLSGNDLDLTATGATAVGVSETIVTAEEIVFTGATGDNRIVIPDNLADALSVEEGANKYQTFVTTDVQAEVVFNQGGLDIDFRVEASGVVNALFVRGSDGFVGIGTNIPVGDLDVSQGAATADVFIQTFSTTDSHSSNIVFQKSSSAIIGTAGETVDAEALGNIFFQGVDSAPTNRSSALIGAVQIGAATSIRVGAKLIFQTEKSDVTLRTQWSILDTGVLEANGAQSITTAGNNALTLDAGTADVIISGPLTIKMGTSSSQMEVMGKANVNTTKVGNVGTGEDDLITYSLPANSLSADGKGVKIKAWGTTAANGNTKTIKLHFGSTVVRQIGASAINDKDWKIDAIVIRTGASTQDALGTEIVDSIALNTHSEPGEDTTTATTIKVTGEATSNNDIVCEGMFTEYIG